MNHNLVRRPGIFTITLYDHELVTLQWSYRIDTFSPKVRYTRSPIAVMLLLWKWIAIRNNISPKEQLLETSLKRTKNALKPTWKMASIIVTDWSLVLCESSTHCLNSFSTLMVHRIHSTATLSWSLFLSKEKTCPNNWT